ncbi:MAG: HupE/UreJ family protein [Bacteroidota bacterium]
MEDFSFYFQWGWSHIVSWDAMDHLLFLLALTAVYLFENRKQVIILITAFTIGHSLTLALSIYDKIHFKSTWVEFLIPVTIVIAASLNFFRKDFENKQQGFKYLLTMIFGFIHGMGFSGIIKMTLAKSQHIALPLLSFNIGIEAGQIVVVFIILLTSQIVVHQLGFKRKWWVWLLSGVSLLGGLYFALTRILQLES